MIVWVWVDVESMVWRGGNADGIDISNSGSDYSGSDFWCVLLGSVYMLSGW